MLINEARALEIYLESATFENGYKPLSYSRIAEQLLEENYKAHKSSVGRWAIKFQWEKLLEAKVKTSIIADEEQSTSQKALVATVEKTLVTVERNATLIADTYDVMENFVEKVKEDLAKGRFKIEEIKLAKDIAVLVTGREDKILDRLANAGDDRISSDALKKEHEAIDVDIEE